MTSRENDLLDVHFFKSEIIVMMTMTMAMTIIILMTIIMIVTMIIILITNPQK